MTTLPREVETLVEDLGLLDLSSLEKAADFVVDAVLHGGVVLACGNGGSAAQASHLVAELVGRLSSKRERPPIPAVSLCDPAVLTAIANDYDFDDVFARQVAAFGSTRSVLVVYSTSGRSPNVLRACSAAHAGGLAVVAFVGRLDDEHPGLETLGVDCVVEAPSSDTGSVQAVHLVLTHSLVRLVEDLLYPPEDAAAAAGRDPNRKPARR